MSAPAAAEVEYNGSCHCGQVKYSVILPADLSSWTLARCNCTICHKKGYLSICPRDPKTLTPISPASFDEIPSYQFGRKVGYHHFCKNCGTSTFARGNVPEFGGEFVMINATTLDGVDFSKVKVGRYWDARNDKFMEGPGPEPVTPGTW